MLDRANARRAPTDVRACPAAAMGATGRLSRPQGALRRVANRARAWRPACCGGCQGLGRQPNGPVKIEAPRRARGVGWPVAQGDRRELRGRLGPQRTHKRVWGGGGIAASKETAETVWVYPLPSSLHLSLTDYMCISTTGVTSKDGKKWEAKITENGKTKYLGFFDTELAGRCLVFSCVHVCVLGGVTLAGVHINALLVFRIWSQSNPDHPHHTTTLTAARAFDRAARQMPGRVLNFLDVRAGGGRWGGWMP